MARTLLLASIGLLGVLAMQLPADDPPEAAPEVEAPAMTAWQTIAPFFTPPAEFAGDLGEHQPVLRFYDGTPVRTAADWKRRREEIRTRWHAMLGPWPELIEKPEIEYGEKKKVENHTQQTVRIRLAPKWEPWTCYLLIPDGDGPFPAVVTVYYYPEAAVTAKRIDYARELARRGFVALSIGRADDDFIARKWKSMARHMPEHQKGTHCYWPTRDAPQLAPLSFMAYAAANAYNALASLAQVDARRVGVVGHSYGGKWAMFATCLYDKFAGGVWSDPGVTIFRPRHGGANYDSPGYLGVRCKGAEKSAYQQIRDGGHDLHELQALMPPRPFLVSGVKGGPDPKEEHTDQPLRWRALNHVVAVNRLLGYAHRVGMSNDRPEHTPTRESEKQVLAFFEHFLKQGKALQKPPGPQPVTPPAD